MEHKNAALSLLSFLKGWVDGKGNEFMTGKPLKTYDEWLAS